jgi:hypothetical protein
LGLATVLEIVRDHDGAMNVRSSPGRGSRFEAWLPAAALAEPATLDPSALALGRGETVLVVKSERERRLRDEEMLAALGYEPVGFESADDAIAACRAAPGRSPCFDEPEDDVALAHAGLAQAVGGLGRPPR